MALFDWSKSYELEIPQIDNQHKELVRMINDLYGSLKGNGSAETVNQTLSQLLRYVEIHFETEERAMLERGYPGFDAHHHLHEDLRHKVFDLEKDQLLGREVATFELLNFLVDWLKNHIAHEDMLFGQYMRNMQRTNLA